MEQILHHLECPKCWFYPSIKTFSGILSGAGFFPSTVSPEKTWLEDDFSCFEILGTHFQSILQSFRTLKTSTYTNHIPHVLVFRNPIYIYIYKSIYIIIYLYINIYICSQAPFHVPYGRWCFLFLAPIDAREDTTIGNVVPPKVEAKDPASNSCTNGDHQVVEHHVEHCMERFHPRGKHALGGWAGPRF